MNISRTVIISILAGILWISPLPAKDVPAPGPNSTYIGSFKSAKISYGRIYQLPSPDSLRTGGITYMGRHILLGRGEGIRKPPAGHQKKYLCYIR